MVSQGIRGYSGKRVLLLQGPIGPFFARLATDLQALGAKVFKVNFNAGDWYYFPSGAINYRGTMDEWPDWLDDLVARLNIDVIFLFGDCRPVHFAARAVATCRGVEVGVFEEGYVRPDYVTLERFGVNGYSRMSRDPEVYRSASPLGPLPAQPVGNSYWAMVWCAFSYYTMAVMGVWLFPHYQHHRPLSLREGWPWLRSIWRKQWYRLKERGLQEALTGRYSQRYFLLPLQVFNDAQIRVHAEMDSLEQFIETAMESFARHAPDDTLLVIKHHPMDRGYRDYTDFIRRFAERKNISARVHYIHDQHLPTLLEHARGVVVVNSTVGLSALLHGAPTVACGNAMYDIAGLTFQGSLNDFWCAAPQSRPDRELFRRFRDYLITRTQLNGSFYKPLKLPGAAGGLIWSPPVADLQSRPVR